MKNIIKKLGKLTSLDLLTILFLMGKWSGFFDMHYGWVFAPVILHLSISFLQSSFLYEALRINRMIKHIGDSRALRLAIEEIKAEKRLFTPKSTDYAWNGACDRCIEILRRYRNGEDE
jgi:hypothetical protein